MYIIKVVSWCDTDFAKHYTIISWLAITNSYPENGIWMCSGIIMWDRRGLMAASVVTTIIPMLANAASRGVEMVGNGRGGGLRLRNKPTGKRWFGGLRFLTVPRMNK